MWTTLENRQYNPRINDNIHLIIKVGQCVCIHVRVTDRFQYMIMLKNYDDIVMVNYTKYNESQTINNNEYNYLSLQTKIGPLPLSKGDFDIIMDLINVSSDDDIHTLLVDGTPIRNLIDILTTNVHLSDGIINWNDNNHVEDLGDDFNNYPYININMNNYRSALNNSNIGLLSFQLLAHISEFTNINNLLNTCKELFCPYMKLKKSTLDSKYSIKKYIYFSPFRNLIDGITNIYELHIDNSQIADISTLVKIKDLYLANCPNITTISTLVNIDILSLNNSQITDINTLVQIEDLFLHNCPNITDISALVNIDTLWLYNSQITDISTLVKIEDLFLNDCPNITYISTLVKIEQLQLCDCFNITDISTLVNICRLYLDNSQIADISTLIKIKDLYLDNCPNITTISTLVNIDTLSLNNSQITDINTLVQIEDLFLRNCPNITDISALVNIDTLSLDNLSILHI